MVNKAKNIKTKVVFQLYLYIWKNNQYYFQGNQLKLRKTKGKNKLIKDLKIEKSKY